MAAVFLFIALMIVAGAISLPLAGLVLLYLPFVLVARRAFGATDAPATSGPILPQALALRAVDAALADADCPDPACLLLLPDGRAPADLARLTATILPVLRAGDLVARVENGVCVTLMPQGQLDLESLIPIASRLQRAAAREGSVSVGFCLPSAAPDRSGKALLSAARHAAEEARRHGPGAIRSFRPDMLALPAPALTRQVIEDGLLNQRFIAHFQPQIAAHGGALSGVEALSRWQHPLRGLLYPPDFLNDLRRAGLSSRLTQAMLAQSLGHLRQWDKAGLSVPSVAINLDRQDLNDPMLPDRILWELDRQDLPPRRLTVEVMETVIADGDPVTVRNIDRLAQMGCCVDLDDFGTGQTGIGQLRRLQVSRIKIDRSFIANLDSDPDQCRIVAAILSMADRLGLETVAEGVESPAVAQRLAEMGCGHLQGWAIARPMPGAQLAEWMAAGRSHPANPLPAPASPPEWARPVKAP